MAERSTVRALFAVATKNNEEIEHLDMKSAYIHTDFMFNKKLYFKEPPRENGQYKHGGTVGVLKKNIYGGKIGAYYFLNEVFTFL